MIVLKLYRMQIYDYYAIRYKHPKNIYKKDIKHLVIIYTYNIFAL